MMRLTVSAASTRVQRREHEVAGLRRADSAVCTVSSSRISPIRITSGSWRSTRRSARLKEAVSCADLALVDDRALVAVQELDRVLDRDDVLRARSFMWSIIAASVVDLPEPVVPVSRMIPRSSSASSRMTAGSASSSIVLIAERDRAADDRDRAALAEGVDAEAREPVERVGEVDLVLLRELLALRGLRQERLASGVVGIGRASSCSQPGRSARASPSTANERAVAGLDVQVGTTACDQCVECLVDVEHMRGYRCTRAPASTTWPRELDARPGYAATGRDEPGDR